MSIKYEKPAIGAWPDDQLAIKAIRREVFVQEQNVPEQEEWDDLDATATHLLIYLAQPNAARLAAYARLLPNGKLTRMAVRKEFRRQGLATILVKTVEHLAAERKFEKITLDAQLQALEFYKKLGFVTIGECFWDAGIQHIHMAKRVTA